MERSIIDGLMRQGSALNREGEEVLANCRRIMTSAVRQAGGSLSLDVVEDLVQQACVRLCADDGRRVRELRGEMPGALYGYARAVAITITLDHFRRIHADKRDNRREVPVDAINAAQPPAAAVVEARIMAGQVDRLLTAICPPATLPRDRRVFWLHYRHGMTAKAIAALPGIALSVKGVESLLYRMITAVRAQLNDGPSNHEKSSGHGE